MGIMLHHWVIMKIKWKIYKAASTMSQNIVGVQFMVVAPDCSSDHGTSLRAEGWQESRTGSEFMVTVAICWQ